MTSLTNLLHLTGGDSVTFQPLDDALMEYKAASSRNPVRLTFGTDMTASAERVQGVGITMRTEKLGLILWLERGKVEKALKVNGDSALINLRLALQEAQKVKDLPQAEKEQIDALLGSLNERLGAIAPV